MNDVFFDCYIFYNLIRKGIYIRKYNMCIINFVFILIKSFGNIEIGVFI